MPHRRSFLLRSAALAVAAAVGRGAPARVEAEIVTEAAPGGPGRVLGPGPAGSCDSERVSNRCVLRSDDAL